MILHGRNLIIKAGGVAIAAAKSCDINVQAAEIPVSSPTDGQWEYAIMGRRKWSVSVGQLVTSIVVPFSMVGTAVTLSMEVDGNVGRPFNGFVDNPTLESGSTTSPYIVWDKTRKKFIGQYINRQGDRYYYEHWPTELLYTNLTNYQHFCIYDEFDEDHPYGSVYTYYNGDLHAEKLTGQANVVEWRATGSVGNLCQGSFRFNGNGALTPASLPATT